MGVKFFIIGIKHSFFFLLVMVLECENDIKYFENCKKKFEKLFFEKLVTNVKNMLILKLSSMYFKLF